MNKYLNIFEYSDFKTFLHGYQQARQKIDSKFTPSRISSQYLGLPNTRNFFKEVVEGDRKLSELYTEKIVVAFEFNEEESKYFRTLVKFGQAVGTQDKEYYFDQLISLNRTPKNYLSPDEFDYYKKWYFSTVRAVLDVMDFDENYKELAEKVYPSIALKEAKESIRVLKKLNLIECNEQGFWKPNAKAITGGAYIKSELIKRQQARFMDLAKDCMLTENKRPKNFSSMTISTTPEMLKKIEKRIQTLKSEIRSMVHKEEAKATHVYQLNVQFFPNSI